MFRSMTSNVSTFSSFVAKSHQTMPYVSSSPLKFRTSGFPQYGFKLVFNWNLHQTTRVKHQACIPSGYPDLYPVTVHLPFFCGLPASFVKIG